MALESEEVGLENLFVDTSDTTATFPDVATEFFKPQQTSTRKPQKSIDEKLQEHIVGFGWCPAIICFGGSHLQWIDKIEFLQSVWLMDF